MSFRDKGVVSPLFHLFWRKLMSSALFNVVVAILYLTFRGYLFPTDIGSLSTFFSFTINAVLIYAILGTCLFYGITNAFDNVLRMSIRIRFAIAEFYIDQRTLLVFSLVLNTTVVQLIRMYS